MLPIVLAVTLLVLATPLVVVLVIGKSRALRKKAAWERHLTPLPEDLLRAVSPLVDPRWIVRLLWYASLLLFLGGLVYASWVILWTLFHVPPTPPLNF
jgi:hypothetical protein